ncbi:hypothetical protein [Bacillus weihaiensis]|uniref:Uncharacterized protein n=1 Tax=Bacillus weihaiensis TaxID=1547283 RepID=A0A1L3MR99_9BACI|nr:hypothetical protein [Bacillus weihaiensis]APH04774.1 hypothetical protein A9C19_08455 [Bacillus weihaiensis]
MNLDWFDRVSSELQNHLESICENYDEVGQMSIERAAKHPRMEFYVELDDEEREYFYTLFYDPYNEEFYFESFDFNLEQTTRAILGDIEDIIDAVHESFHHYMNADEEFEEDSDLFEQIDVEWETPEVTAFIHEDEVEVTYQFGIVEETGDGVLRRINRIKTNNGDMLKDETNFIFSKEEASTMIAMIASHMDSLSDFEF